jgi:hypothetical protein
LLFRRRGNHSGSRGLPGGGRSPAKPVSKGLFLINREFIAKRDGKQGLSRSLGVLNLQIGLRFQWDGTGQAGFLFPSKTDVVWRIIRRVLTTYQA